jgi:hypothetical protein
MEAYRTCSANCSIHGVSTGMGEEVSLAVQLLPGGILVQNRLSTNESTPIFPFAISLYKNGFIFLPPRSS